MQSDAWFREKYDPEFLDVIERERKDNVQASAKEFFRVMDEGGYEKIDLRIKDPVNM